MTRVSFTPAPSEVAMPRTTRATPRVVFTVSAFAFAFIGGLLTPFSSGLGDVCGDRCKGLIEPFLAMFRGKRKARRPQHRHVRDTDESEDELQVRLDMLTWRIRGPHATGRGRNDHLLAFREAFRTRGGVPERLARDHDAIDPGLQLRRH